MSNIHTPTDQVLSKCLDLGTLTTQDSAAVDTRGFTRAKVVVAANTGASSSLDAVIQESNDNGITDPFVSVTGGAIATIPAGQTHATKTISVNLDLRRRYLRVAETVSGTVSGAIFVELYNPELAPVAQDAPAVVV